MAKSTYSHAFLVGYFNARIKPEELNRCVWQPVVYSPEEYKDRCAQYYKSHVDAMLEADGAQGDRPDFLRGVCHYEHSYGSKKKNVCPSWNGVPVSLKVKKGSVREFSFILCSIHLYFFPLDIVLVALEFDDTGTDFNTLTDLHYSMINWGDTFIKADKAELDNNEIKDYLKPLTELLPNKNVANMIVEGSKMKMFQVVQAERHKPNNALLYEIASFCQIGVVNSNSPMSPSESYYENIIKESSVSAFKNWTALALNDSFTVLSVALEEEKGKDAGKEDPANGWAWTWLNLYFPLIYLRCVFEKTFCQSRNSGYRLNKAKDNLVDEIQEMEKYYFYDNISYNFLPTLLYRKMALGMGIPMERETILKQINETLQKNQERNKELMLAGVSAFAVFSIAWDLCSIVKDAFFNKKGDPSVAVVFVCLAVIVLMFLLYAIYRKSIQKWFRMTYITEVLRRKEIKEVEIKITGENREHIKTHFDEKKLGSRFNKDYTPEKLLDEAKTLFPNTFRYAMPDSDGRITISLKFPYTIGVCNVVPIDKLGDKEKKTLHLSQRGDKTVWVAKSNKVYNTSDCQIILSKDWDLITMFPGELAPPLPKSPDIHDEYWDKHVFVEPE